jgi:hypothetical protein
MSGTLGSRYRGAVLGRRRSLFTMRRARRLDQTRRAGLAAAVGLDAVGPGVAGADAAAEVPKVRRVPEGLCPGCGRLGRIDMIDTTTGRAYLSCAVCTTQWDTDRAVVQAASPE